MSIQSEIDRIKEKIAQAYAAISSRHGTLPENESECNLNNLADTVNTIRSAEKIGPHYDFRRIYNTAGKSVYNQGEVLDTKNLYADLILVDLSGYPYKQYARTVVRVGNDYGTVWKNPYSIPTDAFGSTTLTFTFTWGATPYSYTYDIMVRKGIADAGIMWDRIAETHFPNDDTYMKGAGIYYNNGVYLLVPDASNVTYIYRSVDSITWEKIPLPYNFYYFMDVICDPITGLFYIYGTSVHASSGCYSTDGITWTTSDRLGGTTMPAVYCSAVLNGMIFMVGETASSSRFQIRAASISTMLAGEAVSWKRINITVSTNTYDAAVSNDTYMVIVSHSTNHYIHIRVDSTATNGYVCTQADLENIASVIDITCGENGFIALVKTTDDRITVIRTEDAVNWTQVSEDSIVYSLPTNAASIIYGNGMYIIASSVTNPRNAQSPNYDLTYFSTDGVTWDCEYRVSLNLTGCYNRNLRRHHIAYNPDNNTFIQVAGESAFDLKISTLPILYSAPPENS